MTIVVRIHPGGASGRGAVSAGRPDLFSRRGGPTSLGRRGQSRARFGGHDGRVCVNRKREHGDAIVIFGITGDLAFKHIIPALQRMVQADELKVPVVGVAREHWTAEKLAERMRNSLLAGAEGLDPAAHEKLSMLVRYVWGTYDDPRTYVGLRNALGAARARSTTSQSRLSSSRR